MLNPILDVKTTEKFVRLGTRSTDERIAEYSLRNLEKTFTDASMSRQIGREYATKKKIEEEMCKVMEDIRNSEPSEDQIKGYLQTGWVEHLSMMYDPPFWIAEYAARLWVSGGDEGDRKIVGKKEKGKEQSYLMARTYYGLWKRGLDIAFIQPPQRRSITVGPSKGQNVQSNVNQEMYQERMFEFFSALGFGDEVPPVPTGNRPFVQLQDSPAVWAMSLEERQRLAEHWEEEMRRLAYHNHLEEHERLRASYEEACEKYEAVSNEVRLYPFLR